MPAVSDGEPGNGNLHSSASSFTEHMQNERQGLLNSSQKSGSGSSKNPPGYRTFAGLEAITGNSQSGSGISTPRDSVAGVAGSSTTKTIKRKIKNVNYWTYYVPILSWLPEYSIRLLPGDIAAGLTVSLTVPFRRGVSLLKGTAAPLYRSHAFLCLSQ